MKIISKIAVFYRQLAQNETQLAQSKVSQVVSQVVSQDDPSLNCNALFGITNRLKEYHFNLSLAVEALEASASLTSYNNPQADFTKPATAEESCGRKAKSNT